jgi:hypothetical protein
MAKASRDCAKPRTPHRCAQTSPIQARSGQTDIPKQCVVRALPHPAIAMESGLIAQMKKQAVAQPVPVQYRPSSTADRFQIVASAPRKLHYQLAIEATVTRYDYIPNSLSFLEKARAE